MLLLEVCGLAAPRSCGSARKLRGLALAAAVDDDFRDVGERVAASFAYDTTLLDQTGSARRATSLTRALLCEQVRQTLGIQIPLGVAPRWSGKNTEHHLQIFLPISATRQPGIPDAPLKHSPSLSLP